MPRILVIEDESAIRRVLVKILSEENESYVVEEAEDGAKGLELIKKTRFVLIEKVITTCTCKKCNYYLYL